MFNPKSETCIYNFQKELALREIVKLLREANEGFVFELLNVLNENKNKNK